MITFIIEKAKELGAQNCPHCGKLDFCFGLSGAEGGGECILCSKPVQKYSKEKTLRFSLEVFKELWKSYDDFDANKQMLIDVFDNLLFFLVKFNKVPTNERLIQFQSFLKALDNSLIGSGAKLSGAIHFKNGVADIALDNANLTMANVQSLAVCLSAIRYIQDFKVLNEFATEGHFRGSMTSKRTYNQPLSGWSCDICEGDSQTGCLMSDPQNCPHGN